MVISVSTRSHRRQRRPARRSISAGAAGPAPPARPAARRCARARMAATTSSSRPMSDRGQAVLQLVAGELGQARGRPPASSRPISAALSSRKTALTVVSGGEPQEAARAWCRQRPRLAADLPDRPGQRDADSSDERDRQHDVRHQVVAGVLAHRGSWCTPWVMEKPGAGDEGEQRGEERPDVALLAVPERVAGVGGPCCPGAAPCRAAPPWWCRRPSGRPRRASRPSRRSARRPAWRRRWRGSPHRRRRPCRRSRS